MVCVFCGSVTVGGAGTGRFGAGHVRNSRSLCVHGAYSHVDSYIPCWSGLRPGVGVTVWWPGSCSTGQPSLLFVFVCNDLLGLTTFAGEAMWGIRGELGSSLVFRFDPPWGRYFSGCVELAVHVSIVILTYCCSTLV